jgi:hypothetical protein
MKILNRLRLLKTFRVHETLKLEDISKEENLGMVPDLNQLNYMLTEMTDCGYLKILNDIVPATYSITDDGIQEYERLTTDADNQPYSPFEGMHHEATDIRNN